MRTPMLVLLAALAASAGQYPPAPLAPREVPAAGSVPGFVPVAPCRVADTRTAPGVFGAPVLAGGQVRNFPIPASACHIPATARAYSLNVTVVPSSPSLGYLTLWPAGTAQPLVSTLNSPHGSIVANAAIVPAGTGGAVSVYVTDPADLVLDINGYFDTSSSSLVFYALPPCRAADTRNPAGPLGGPALGAGQSRDFAIPSSLCAAPASAGAYSMNVTAVPSGPLGYLTVWPAGAPLPLVSTLNSPLGRVTANAALVPAGTSGAISVLATDSTDLVLDIDGYFGPLGGPSPLSFYPVTPCRVADTRLAPGVFGGPTLAAGSARDFPLLESACGIPASAQAYSLNLTVVPRGFLGFLRVWPTGSPQPAVSTLNSTDGSVVANAAIVPTGVNGSLSVFVTDATDLVIDINGYFAPTIIVVPLSGN